MPSLHACARADKQRVKIINKHFHIGCNDGAIIPIVIQREGKKPMEIKEFLKGFTFSVGQTINA